MAPTGQTLRGMAEAPPSTWQSGLAQMCFSSPFPPCLQRSSVWMNLSFTHEGLKPDSGPQDFLSITTSPLFGIKWTLIWKTVQTVCLTLPCLQPWSHFLISEKTFWWTYGELLLWIFFFFLPLYFTCSKSKCIDPKLYRQMVNTFSLCVCIYSYGFLGEGRWSSHGPIKRRDKIEPSGDGSVPVVLVSCPPLPAYTKGSWRCHSGVTLGALEVVLTSMVWPLDVTDWSNSGSVGGKRQMLVCLFFLFFFFSF